MQILYAGILIAETREGRDSSGVDSRDLVTYIPSGASAALVDYVGLVPPTAQCQSRKTCADWGEVLEALFAAGELPDQGNLSLGSDNLSSAILTAAEAAHSGLTVTTTFQFSGGA